MKTGYFVWCVFFMMWMDSIHGNGREEIVVPMCKGLIDYTHTKLPNDYNHTTQAEVYRELEPLWAFMDQECSRNFRTLVCSLYLPKATEDGRIVKPCRATCFRAKRRCFREFKRAGFSWKKDLTKCGPLERSRDVECIRPVREGRRRPNRPNYLYYYAGYCQPYAMSMCQNFTNNQWLGTLPNPFLQDNEILIDRELQQYQALVDSGCHDNLWFLLCTIFKPRCPSNDNPIVLPCREFCNEVKSSCKKPYSDLYGGLRWNAKLQCHRYPETASGTPCIAPDTSSDD